MKSRGVRAFVVGLVAALALSACGSNEDSGDGGSDETPTTGTPSPSDDTEGLTEAGTELDLGETATIQWRPVQRVLGRVEIAVTRIDQTTMKDFEAFKLDAQLKKDTPYYVHVDVKNVGDTDLSGRTLPMYLDDGTDVLIPAAKINSEFEPCPSTPLPQKFRPGKSTEVCLVFLAPQGHALEAIVARPESLPEAISWTGKITTPVKDKPRKHKGKKH